MLQFLLLKRGDVQECVWSTGPQLADLRPHALLFCKNKTPAQPKHSGLLAVIQASEATDATPQEEEQQRHRRLQLQLQLPGCPLVALHCVDAINPGSRCVHTEDNTINPTSLLG